MSVQQGGTESWQGSPSPVERGLFMLDVPGLKMAAGLGMRVSIDHHPAELTLSCVSIISSVLHSN